MPSLLLATSLLGDFIPPATPLFVADTELNDRLYPDEVSPLAQAPPPPSTIPLDLPPEDVPDPPEPLPTLPSLEELLRSPALQDGAPSLETPAITIPGTLMVQSFRVLGSTIFSEAELAAVTAEFTGRPITFAELLEARSAITQRYVEAGYITTGAFVPTDQVIEDGIVEIQVVEGFLEAVMIDGLEDLAPGYVSRRVHRAAGRPLNVDSLVEGLQLLQIDPLIDSISAELATGTQVGGSILTLQVEEAKSLGIQLAVDNGRSPIVGSVRGEGSLRDINLLGFGDALDLAYSFTQGSDTFNVGYTVPVSAANTTLGITYALTRSEVIEEDFEILSIESESEDLQVFLRHPILQTPRQELALSLEFAYSRLESSFRLPGESRLGFAFPGAPDGDVDVTVIRFGQDWTRRSADQVLAARSRFSVGTDALGGTDNDGDVPDSNFFSWQGQAQYLQVLAPDTLLLARLDGQLAAGPLLSLEQFRLGGLGSVRGFREDALIADNGLFASVEVRLPVLRIPELESVVQLTPFVDVGYAFNSGRSPEIETRVLAAAGAGILWQASDRFTARLDYGIPLVNGDSSGDSLQENGLLFSIIGRF